MLRLALLFLIVAVVAGIFGFTGLAVSVAYMAKIIFAVALCLFIAALITGRVRAARL